MYAFCSNFAGKTCIDIEREENSGGHAAVYVACFMWIF